MLDKTIVNIIMYRHNVFMDVFIFLFQLLFGLPAATEELGFLKL